MSIYHLHIPRTSGGSFRSSIINNFKNNKVLAGHHTKISLDDFRDSDFISGHYGVGPARYAQKTFTILRDPNELTYSYIKYLAFVSGDTLANEKSLIKYLYDESLSNSVTNINSKFITLEVDLGKYNRNVHDHLIMANNSWFLKDTGISHDDTISSVLSNNIKVFFFDDQNLYANISEYLNIEMSFKDVYILNASIKEDGYLYNKYFDRINHLNGLDNKVFKTLKSLV